MTTDKEKKELSFESSLSRLEVILEKMNTGAVALEDALKLYEEADQLIGSCNKRLNEAMSKVEILIKNRSGDVEISKDGKPSCGPYSISNGSSN